MQQLLGVAPSSLLCRERFEEDEKSIRPCHLLRTLIVQLQIAS
jgi:hypothetical protein